jgi:hypothetical protein
VLKPGASPTSPSRIKTRLSERRSTF